MTGTERDASSAVGADVADASAPTEERERALMQRVAELEAIVESSPDVIACFDRSLRHVYVNRAVEAASGMPRDAFLGKDHDELGLPRELTEAWQAVCRHVFETGEEGTKAFEFEGANGVRSFVSRVVPMREADGTVSRVLSVARDVTDQRRAEQERLEIERKLSQANKLESLGILAGGIAHDFNNLLTGIIAGASLLRYRQADASVVAHAARQIERSGVRAAELCRQMLAYAGRAQSIERVSDLRAMASETVNLLSASLPAGVHVTLEHAGGPVAVRGDATQLRQVLMNLVLNAAEAIGARGGEVRVRTSEVDAKDVALERAIVAPASLSGRFVRLEVTDDGSGMDDETRTRIFDPFFTTKFQGRGLGLSATLGTVRGHGGVLSVSSNLDRGTSFVLHFPSATTGADDDTESEPPDASAPIEGRLLVVDDDPSVREASVLMARALGLDVIATDGAERALALIGAGEHFDVALIDLVMPGTDGVETLHGIRAIAPTLPVVMMSGYAEEVALGRLGSLAIDAFLEKPFRLTTMHDAIRRARAR